MDPEALQQALREHLGVDVEVERFDTSVKVRVRLLWDGQQFDSSSDSN